MSTATSIRARDRLYDEDARGALRIGAPLTAALLVAEGAAHWNEADALFLALCAGFALVIAPMGQLAAADRILPARLWTLPVILLNAVVLLAHLPRFSFPSSSYLAIAMLFASAALIIHPRVFATAFVLFVVLLSWALVQAESFELRVFCVLCLPLVLALYYSRRRALFAGERERSLERALDRQREETDLVRRVVGINQGMSHHFNNVFMGIIGGTSHALDLLEADHPARAALEQAQQSGEDGSRLIEQLGLSGADAREAFAAVDVRELLEDPTVLAVLPPHLELDTSAAADTPRVPLQRGGLTRALRELIENAVEAIGERDGAIRVELTRQAESGDLGIDVIDSGAGMREEEIPRSVEPFYTTRDPSRRGLGLPFVLGVVERHGGTLSITSRPGQGTRVRITLPDRPT